ACQCHPRATPVGSWCGSNGEGCPGRGFQARAGGILCESETSLASSVPGSAGPKGWALCSDEIYKSITSWCWEEFREWMLGVPGAQLCEWRVISRPYSNLRDCLETLADKLNYSDGYPNGVADKFIVLSHHTYFLNCTQEHPVFLDPPEDLLLALIFAPICLIPFLVTLVVWRSKDSKMQA
uniref:Receptor activity modifying protein 2 n=1 Tax=Pelodiscus sinensis TaxID=13735 RepID=K7F9E1_PELSI